ncbi:MAG TPA: hypothetical protein VHO06_04095 [Polyangia bacterium]|nr:hypothetical protein [Polyangia bacterium]
MRRPLLLVIAVAAAAAWGTPARAFEAFTPTEALGTGEASRAWATSDAGPLLNPSGMSLTKAYTITGTYGYASGLSDQFLHASIVDSTSPFNVAGGLYYTYHATDPSGAGSGHGHEAGLALSYPFGPYVALGGTLKYFNLAGSDTFDGHDGGFTFDLGATVRPTSIVSLGVVGTNLRSLSTSEATQAVGYGVALVPSPKALVVLDGLTRFTADDHTGRKGTSVMGGGGYTFLDKLGVRAGGGYDAATGNGYLTFGLSGVSALGAIDGGLRQDLTSGASPGGGSEKRQTVVGVNLRLFVPAAEPEAASLDLEGPQAPVTSP